MTKSKKKEETPLTEEKNKLKIKDDGIEHTTTLKSKSSKKKKVGKKLQDWSEEERAAFRKDVKEIIKVKNEKITEIDDNKERIKTSNMSQYFNALNENDDLIHIIKKNSKMRIKKKYGVKQVGKGTISLLYSVVFKIVGDKSGKLGIIKNNSGMKTLSTEMFINALKYSE
jgi:hypothetical protein